MLIVLVTGSTEPACQGQITMQYITHHKVNRTHIKKFYNVEVINSTWTYQQKGSLRDDKSTSLKTTLCKDCTDQLDQSGTSLSMQ